MMWRHPKYYKELSKKRKELQRQKADKLTSEQAIEETFPHNDIEEANKPTSEQADKPASDQASNGSRINKRSI